MGKEEGSKAVRHLCGDAQYYSRENRGDSRGTDSKRGGVSHTTELRGEE